MARASRLEVSERMPRVAAKAVIIRDRKLLVIVKRDTAGEFFLLPGGGQDMFEPLHATLRRECLEEIAASVEPGDLLFVRDYIGRNHEFAAFDRDAHQVDLMFACSVPADYEPRIGDGPDSDQTDARWLPLDELATARIYPAALREALLQPRLAYLGDVN
jgi:ADP-ribose pyrophosphatase YjhB (NUDIX family)